MKCFNYIAKKLTNVDKVDNICNDELILQINFEIFCNMPFSVKKKFSFYHNINHNGFITQAQKNDFNNKFYDIQKACAGFQKFAYMYKYNKAPIIVDTDICLNKINITDKNVICIYQNNFKYLFNILDLIKITNNALTHCESFYSDPKPLKNPYNNMHFSKSNLYNIYFYIKYSTHLYSELLFKYFHVDFNLSEYTTKYEYLLREYSIENYIKSSSTNILFVEILRMFNGYNYSRQKKFIISSNFPQESLVKIMKPYLLLHMQSQYSLVQTKKTHAGAILHQKLLALYKFNSNFGKKIMYQEAKLGFKKNGSTKNKIIHKFYFDDKHIPFNQNIHDFLTTHISANNADNDEDDSSQFVSEFEHIVYNIESYYDEHDQDTNDEDEPVDEVIGVIDSSGANNANNEENDESNDEETDEADDNSVS